MNGELKIEDLVLGSGKAAVKGALDTLGNLGEHLGDMTEGLTDKAEGLFDKVKDLFTSKKG